MTIVPASTTITTIAPATRARVDAAPAHVLFTSEEPRKRILARDHVTARNFDHESLWSLCCRRLSFAMYRKTARYHRQLVVAPQRGMAEHILPVPLLADTIAVYLSSHLPVWMVARLGHSGLVRVARGPERVFKAAGRIAKYVLSPVLSLGRWVRSRRAARHAEAHRKAAEARFLIDAPDGQPLNMLLDGRVMVGAVRSSPSAMYLSLRKVRPVRESIQIFAHAYPEDPAVLPEARRELGFFCKDHNPLVEASRWPKHKWYRDETWLGDLPSGYYRIEVGIIERGTLRKFPLNGTTRTSIDLGWVRVGNSEGAQ